MKHTPEPWRCYADKRYGDSGNVHYYDWIIESGSRKLMAVLSVPALNVNKQWRREHPEAMKENLATRREVAANAKRIVDCVNACWALKNPTVELRRLLNLADKL